MANIQLRVTAKNGLNVRSQANTTTAKIIATNPYGTVVNATETTQYLNYTWYKLPNGWSSGKYLEVISKDSITPGPTNNTDNSKAAASAESTKKAAETDIGSYNTTGSTNSMSGLKLPYFRMVHGMPFQFTNTVDRRVDGGYGWMYAKDYLATTPIVSFIPGSPKFLAGFSIGTKNQVIASLATDVQTALNDIQKGLSKDMQYYTHTAEWDSYYDYVNTCCRVTADLMGIGNEEIDGKKLSGINWKEYNTAVDKNYGKKFNDIIRGLTGVDDAVLFSYEPNSSIGNNLNNSTGESALAGATKSASAKAREAEFLLGAGAGIEFEWTSDEYIEQMIPKMSDVSKYDPKSPIQRIFRQGKSVATGANLLFPEIWNDSSYVKDYSIDVKLESPYATKLSKFLYVMVPFWHLFCLAGPRSMDTNAYVSPFLIKAYSKGYFDVQLGMIDSISFKKYGDGESMGDDMIPMSMELTISFKDLYQALSITSMRNSSLFFNNTGFIDMLGTMSGVSMNRESMLDRVLLFAEQKWYTSVTDIPGRLQETLIDLLKIRDLAKGIMGNEIN